MGGDFLDFVQDASKKDSPIRDEFLRVFNDPNVTAQSLCDFLHGKDYTGVTLEHCEKMIAARAHLGTIEAGDIGGQVAIKY
ncbi:MAG: hypothetical protein P8182_16985 [Deltaproteobacteria bacterium]